MATLVRWDPFREMVSLRREMDRMFDDALTGNREGYDQTYRWELPLDVKENENEYVVKASVPGVNPDDIDITYNSGTLTISAETHAEEERKDEHFLVRERRYGTFTRSITLPTTINADKIDANYDAGILTLHLPKAEEVKPRRINVKAEKFLDAKANK